MAIEIVDLPIKKGDFPYLCNSLPEGIPPIKLLKKPKNFCWTWHRLLVNTPKTSKNHLPIDGYLVATISAHKLYIHRFTSPKTILLKEHLHPNSYRKHPNYIQQKYENKMAIRHLDPPKKIILRKPQSLL